MSLNNSCSIELYDLTNESVWNDIVKGFTRYDVYYLSGYVKAFQIHGDGEPLLLYYKAERIKAIYVFMKRKTEIDGFYDSITPYGYGGVLFEGDTSDMQLQAFWKAYVEKMKDERIVDSFIRYHPLLANAKQMRKISPVIDLGKTVAIDLISRDVVWENINSKNRNMIRKAQKNGVEIRHSKDVKLFKDFKRIYDATMVKNHVKDYYFFGDAFYESIHQDLNNNFEIFYALKDGQIIAMSIILYANDMMHYHLSGTMMDYRSLAPSNLLLYKAALWGCECGFKQFHLGGGIGSCEDDLYKFKAVFNRHSDYQFSVGKEIFDHDKYDELVALRAKLDPRFDADSKFFPLYRS